MKIVFPVLLLVAGLWASGNVLAAQIWPGPGAKPHSASSASPTSGSASGAGFLDFRFRSERYDAKIRGAFRYALAFDPAQRGDHAKCQAG